MTSRSRWTPLLVAAGLLALSSAACSRADGDTPSVGAGGSGNVGSGAASPGGVGNGSGGSVTPGGGAGGSAGSVVGGGSAGMVGSGGAVMPEQPDFLAERGLSFPFATYEAETMTTNGLVTDASRQPGVVQAEASGRRAVRLLASGSYVEFQNLYQANSIVVRYSTPDAGLENWVTLSVFVNGESRGKLNLTTRYSWSYGGEEVFNKPGQKDSSQGSPHHFWDEAHALIGDVPAGATVTVRKEAEDTATYHVDFVEMEQVPEPLPQPAGSISLTDCGATPNDAGDDTAALQTCVNMAQGKGLYIPAGAFQTYGAPIVVPANVTISGAGMWHSSVNGYGAQFRCDGGGCQFKDFSAFGDTVSRDDATEETFLRGNGNGCVVENVWVEHVKLGVWTDKATNGLTVKNSRFRNLHADGVNFYNGTLNSVVEGSHFRNTGDDAIAAWSHTWESPGPSHANTWRKNYIQLPWRANCFGIYGGADNTIEDNVCADVVMYPGMFFARQFDSHDFTGMTNVTRNTILRAGGSAYEHTHGALKFHADQGPVANITVTDMDIVDPTYSGVHAQGPGVVSSVWLNDVTITNPGNASFFLNAGSQGSLDAVSVVVSGGVPAVLDESEGAFNLIKGSGSSGW
jgi:hypothetical protein